MAGAADLGSFCRKQKGLWLASDPYGIEVPGAAFEPKADCAPDEGKPDGGRALPPDEVEATFQNSSGS